MVSFLQLVGFTLVIQDLSKILIDLLPDLHEARAILLGRLGRHDQALETYIYLLQDFMRLKSKSIQPTPTLGSACISFCLVRHCKRIYKTGSETGGVFLTLLRIYLRPTVQTTADLLQPALDFISRHGPRLDAVETLQ